MPWARPQPHRVRRQCSPTSCYNAHALAYVWYYAARTQLLADRTRPACCLFVCLLVCLLACLFVCLFVCLLVSGLMLLLTFICSTTRLLVCLFMFRSALLVVDSERLHVIFIEWTLRKSSLVTLMRRLHVMHAQQMPQMDKPLCRHVSAMIEMIE